MFGRILMVYLALANGIAFAMYGIDKRKAIKDQWRIPEKTLFWLAVIGGSLGTTLGMHMFRHKTKHWYFKFGMPFILIVQIILIIYFVT